MLLSKLVFNTVYSNNNKWEHTINRVVSAVVSIQFSHVTPFDTETTLVSEASGFVVDAERGLILTNRHVVGPGPFTGYVVFDNHESVDVKPIYRDPIHDFGFLQFDTRGVRYLKLTKLDLEPQLAKVGTEIRVVGNDNGEKLSILAGIISRIDRNAPNYGELEYSDFNTEYIQAAASASGGSSGSPVINKDGKCVALQAGGATNASTDFFLPVNRPKRALQCIQHDMPITRGDIQVEWQLKPFNECSRLGLSSEAETKARELFPGKIGLLVALLVLPGGPADGIIEEGDTLISVNGEYISTFVRLDEILDENVGKNLDFVVQRSQCELKQSIKIGNLHDITPDRYVQVAGATFNNLSYHVASCYCLPVKGVYVCDAMGSFKFAVSDRNGYLLDTVDDKPVTNLDEFVEIIKKLPDRSKFLVSYRHVSDMHAKYIQTIRNSLGSSQNCAKWMRSFAGIKILSLGKIDCYPLQSNNCYGVVVDAANGFVLVSRMYVPHYMCDVIVEFAEAIDVPGKIVFLHPHLNYAIIKYDPKLVLADVQSPKFSNVPLKRGDDVLFIGHKYDQRVVTEEVKVSSVSSVNATADITSPCYYGTNLECVLLDSKIAQECTSGVLMDNDGTLRAIWLSFLSCYKMALDVTDVAEVISSLQENQISPSIRMLSAVRFEEEAEDYIRLFFVNRVAASRIGEKPYPLKVGDVVLSVDDKIVTNMRGFHSMYQKESLVFKIIREKKEMTLEVPTIETDTLETSQVVNWCGMMLQKPHFAVWQLMTKIPSEVFVVDLSDCGPSYQYDIEPVSFITHVNDEETIDLESFIKRIREIPDNTFVKLRMVSIDIIPTAISLKTNYHYFPTTVL
ncbi:NMA111, partial [Candida oxycetoniae]